MTIAATYCRGQLGLSAPLVQVEVNLGAGLPVFSIVGLPATAVKESKERVRAALTNSGFEFPPGRITVNLAPADLPKEGGRFDLPIALGILLASRQVLEVGRAGGSLPREFYGELSLSGELLPVRGLTLAAAHAARRVTRSSCRWPTCATPAWCVTAAPSVHAACSMCAPICAVRIAAVDPSAARVLRGSPPRPRARPRRRRRISPTCGDSSCPSAPWSLPQRAATAC